MFIYFIKLSSEIKQRITAQQLLQESEEKWRSLAKNAPSFLSIVNKEHIIEYINSPIPGLKHEDIIGHAVYEFIQPEYHDIARKMINNVFETGRPCKYESFASGPEGTMAYYDNRLGPIIISDIIIAVSIFGLDITERKLAEDSLRTSESKYRQLIQTASDAIYLLSADGKVLDVNHSACLMLNRTKDEMLRLDIYGTGCCIS